MSKRIKSARKAYEKADLEEAKKAHTAETIKRDMEEHTERHKTDQGKYVGDMVYGANDGILTTFAIVSGVVGASLPTSVILTGVALFGFGSARSLVIRRKWYVAGLEMLIVGGLTAVVSYSVGLVLGGLV